MPHPPAAFDISSQWLARAGEAVGSRNGVALKACLVEAENGDAGHISDDSPAHIASFVSALQAQVGSAVRTYLRQHPLYVVSSSAAPSRGAPPQYHARGGGGRPHRSGAELWHAAGHAGDVASAASTVTPAEAMERNDKEVAHGVEVLVRAASTGAVVAFQRAHRIIVSAPSENLGATGASTLGTKRGRLDPADTTPTATSPSASPADTEAMLHRSCQSTALRGLLFTFEAFQSMHSMPRDHYPPRRGNRTAGTVGWDTLVLLYFVHRLPNIAREASGVVVDGAIGETVRTWRKLLLSVQNADPQEAPEHSRRRGALGIVNGLLSILFQRYNTSQCTALLQSVKHTEDVATQTNNPAKSILAPSLHMTSEVITYYYFKGRMALYERQLSEAHGSLRHAYTLLPPPGQGTEIQHRNKERTRFFLMVAGLVSGLAAPDPMTSCDPVLQQMFAPMRHAIQLGNPALYNKALEIFGATLRRRGVYLILQRAKILCYLMLLARVHAGLAAIGADPSRVTLANLVGSYHFVQERETGADSLKGTAAAVSPASPCATSAVDDALLEDGSMTEDRMAVWVAKLIARGYVRGYLSLEHKTIVLARKDPFPLFIATAMNGSV